VVVCEIWPGITPWNIWDLAWCDWILFAAAADRHVAQSRLAKERARG